MHSCTYKRTSWGDYQCIICYEFRHKQDKENNE